MFPSGHLPAIQQPWGFDGVKREQRNVFADSRNFYVDPNHIDATDANDGEDPEHPVATIQRAVNLCRAYKGDSIYVGNNDSWQYGTQTQNTIAESVVIPNTKPGIRIIGVSSGTMGCYWTPALTTEFCLTIEALDVEVAGFCFWGRALVASNGIFVHWLGTTKHGENCHIHDCYFTDDLTIGIQLEYVWFYHIYNNHFQECKAQGIFVDTAGAGSAYGDIHHNSFHDCAAAMVLEDTDRTAVHQNHIYNTDAQNGAVATNTGINTTGGEHNMVFDNYFSCILPAAANGDWDDMNSGTLTDCWAGNMCINGLAVTTPT
jgi:hypothetical protein